MGDRIRGRRPQSRPPGARNPGRLPPPGPGRDRPGPGRGAGYRLPVLARSSLHARAPGMVQAPPRRFDPVRGEPAQEVRGHLSLRLRDRALEELWQELLSIVLFWAEQG